MENDLKNLICRNNSRINEKVVGILKGFHFKFVRSFTASVRSRFAGGSGPLQLLRHTNVSRDNRVLTTNDVTTAKRRVKTRRRKLLCILASIHFKNFLLVLLLQPLSC